MRMKRLERLANRTKGQLAVTSAKVLAHVERRVFDAWLTKLQRLGSLDQVLV
jgi:hypothetical protein